MNRENKLGLQIKQQRKLLGLTQEQLAEKAGIDNKHLSKIENSIPTDTTFIEITKIYTSAKTTKEKNYYLEMMKLAQKGLNINL